MTDADHEIVIIGAGLSGIGMGVMLRRAELSDFVIFERAEDIGGTWRDNTYPGIAVDIPAQAYQFSFELNPTWSRTFAPGAEVKAYVDHVADTHQVRDHVRFGSEVAGRRWDEDEHLWHLSVNGSDVTARYVISAIGPFVDPKPADIPGVDDFAGTTVLSSRWDHDVDLAGKRVAIIGTGASAVQIVPKIARTVAQLDVYQRTPIWVGPKFDPPTPAVLRRVFRRAPAVQDRVRRVAVRGAEAVLIDLVLGYSRAPVIGAGLASMARNVWYRSQVPDAALRRRLTPDYSIGCKRPSVSNTYLRSFMRENVELVTDRIDTITPTGVRTEDGTERPVDVLILATGFRLASDPENYRRTPVQGRDGFDLATSYEQQRLSSYEGVSMPGLPNHFMMFGPYGWIGGTWHQLVETNAAHIVRVIKEARRRGATAVEVRVQASDAWTEQMRDRMGGSVFLNGQCVTAHSYYFDQHGDVPFLRPTSSAQARRAAAHFPLEDYSYSHVDSLATTGRAS